VTYATEKALKDYGDKMSAGEKEKVEKALADLKKAKENEKADEIKRATEAVTQASHEFSKHLYEEAAKQQAAAGGQAPPPNGGPGPQAEAGAGKPGDEKIIDADFKTK
jgi:molecular chaperone DnaK